DPFDGRALIDEALCVRPVTDGQRRLACGDELDTPARAALKDLVLLSQTAKIDKTLFTTPKLEETVKPLKVVRVVNDLAAFPHRSQQAFIGFRDIVRFNVSFVVSQNKGILKCRSPVTVLVLELHGKIFVLGRFVAAENVFLLEDGKAAPAGHAVKNVGGVIFRCVLADDAIDQSAGTGPQQIDFDERILLLEHVNELFALGDRDRRVPCNAPYLFRLGDNIRTSHLSQDGSETRPENRQDHKEDSLDANSH